MMATALQFSLEKTINEREQLSTALDKLQRESAAQIRALNEELAYVREHATQARQAAGSAETKGARAANPQAVSLVAEISRSVAQLRLVMGVPESKPPSGKTPAESDFINITF